MCYGERHRTTFVLHVAAAMHTEEVVAFLLNHGANPDLPDVDKNKPIHLAVERLMQIQDMQSKDVSRTINIIARLLLNSLKRALPKEVNLTAVQIVDELLRLDFPAHAYRENICRALFHLDTEMQFMFTENELLSLLNSQLGILYRNEIYFDVAW